MQRMLQNITGCKCTRSAIAPAVHVKENKIIFISSKPLIQTSRLCIHLYVCRGSGRYKIIMATYFNPSSKTGTCPRFAPILPTLRLCMGHTSEFYHVDSSKGPINTVLTLVTDIHNYKNLKQDSTLYYLNKYIALCASLV